ncbi:MAG: hypothetical protein IJQ33_08795, partial [Clostridia bacterium]|nr:hypothetical protein [Clostridia bacterium]
SVFGRKMSVSGQFCPKTPFYKKLMKPSKACFSWLSMAGCRLCRHPEGVQMHSPCRIGVYSFLVIVQ